MKHKEMVALAAGSLIRTWCDLHVRAASLDRVEKLVAKTKSILREELAPHTRKRLLHNVQRYAYYISAYSKADYTMPNERRLRYTAESLLMNAFLQELVDNRVIE